MSESKPFYLREDVYFEPLINSWYVWPYLIPPVSGARHMINTHRRIMSSFVKNFKLHQLAIQTPGMAGGEFLDCTEAQVGDIKALVSKIDEEHSDIGELSDAVRIMDDLMRAHVSGETIEHLYQQVPAPLQGYVEITMDLYHHPSYRLIENLLYKSKYYKKQLQSVSFGLLSHKERPFVLSTPRLADEHHLQLAVDYNHPTVRGILSARDNPISQSEIDALFASCQTSGGLDPQALFTQDPPTRRHEPVLSGARLQYTGHAGFFIETKDIAILVDPVIASRGPDYADEVISFSELPPQIDYILITHNHQDHLNLETLLQLRHKTNTIVVPRNNGGSLADPSLRLLLQQFDFNVIDVEDMQQIPFVGGCITALPFLGEHGDLNIRAKTAWLVNVLGNKVFLGADSANLDPHLYRHIHAITGDIDYLAIGMECVGAPYTWIYGALNTQKVSKAVRESRRLNGCGFEQAYQMVNTFKPSQVFIYALGLEPWYKYFMGIDYDENSEQIVQSGKMLAQCKEQGIAAESLYAKRTILLAAKN